MCHFSKWLIIKEKALWDLGWSNLDIQTVNIVRIGWAFCEQGIVGAHGVRPGLRFCNSGLDLDYKAHGMRQCISA